MNGPAVLDNPFAGIRLLLLDCDGVLTDGRLYFGTDGTEIKAFHTRDGYGLKAVMAAGITVGVVTGRRSDALRRRLDELSVPWLWEGVSDKAALLTEITQKTKISKEHAAFIGDDVPDLSIMSRVGCAVAVADAHPAVIAAARVVTGAPGGQGAVREVCDRLLAAASPRETKPAAVDETDSCVSESGT
jgi:3-deoxy-D-manno-octulosonate 8-phosphate phosphatase (KDO 8-P phosphatase)